MLKDVIILTKSAKHKKYCVAGVDFHSGSWVRLVSSDEDARGALSPYDMRTKDGGYCEPLDLVSVEVEKAVPQGCQTENFLIVYGRPWIKHRKSTIEEVVRIHRPTTRSYIFGNDKPFIPGIDWMKYSLLLAEVTQLEIYQNEGGKSKANFIYKNHRYNGISLTDPVYFGWKSETVIEKAYIVVSIPNDPYEGKYYKFIAKIFPVKDFFGNR